jgi:hypothetical protein
VHPKKVLLKTIFEEKSFYSLEGTSNTFREYKGKKRKKLLKFEKTAFFYKPGLDF